MPAEAAVPMARLLLVLHCHLPYVRHPEHDLFVEEEWFYEAVAEAYVPLLLMMERLEAEGVPFRAAVSLSPTLCEMMSNALLRTRCIRYLEGHAELAAREVRRTRGSPFHEAALMYERRYGEALGTFADRFGGRLLDGFAALRQAGRIELLGSAATHAVLPLLKTPEGRRAQVGAGLANFQKHFGGRPQAFWLPECAYAPGVEDLLAGFGIRAFFLDTHGLLLAEPRPPFGVFAPLFTPAGPAAFGRDVESSRQVWSAAEGYPGHPDYREFYRDLGYDADPAYLGDCLGVGGPPRPIGFKYHRVTGRDVPLGEKQPYEPARAAARAAAHAAQFVQQRLDQARRVHAAIGIDPVIVCPYDAELFGHWWFEGPQFLEAVAREAARVSELAWTTPSECLDRADALQEGRPAFSTWGDGGYLDVWVNSSNDWMYAPLEAAEREMAEAASTWPRPDPLHRRALNQCARELLLAQASDWPFLISAGTAAAYARSRFGDLMGRFNVLLGQLRQGVLSEATLSDFERRDDAFPEMDYAVFAPSPGVSGLPPRLTQ